MTNCADVMTKNPVNCLPTDTVFRAAQLMRDQDVGPVPVIEGHDTKTVVGIVTDRDLAIKVLAEGRDIRDLRADGGRKAECGGNKEQQRGGR